MKYSILIADDDPLCLSALNALLTSHGHSVQTATTADQAIEIIKNAERRFALCILDYRLEERNGADVAAEVLNLNPDVYILIHSGDNSRDALRKSWRAGAVGFIEKSEPVEVFLETVKNWCQKFEALHQTCATEEVLLEASPAVTALNMVGRSAAMRDIAEKVTRYKKRKDSVLIVGETGTGKEKIARAFSDNTKVPFLAVNCAAYNGNSDLMESELFGYVRGAFTGAIKDSRGLFEEAGGGIVFLDEIHTLSQKAQQKLLRALQEKRVRPVGGHSEYSIDFRLIAAAKPEIDRCVDSGAFLPDFFERVNVLRINIPPLRERPEDIELLVAHFCRQYEKETGESKQFLTRTLQYLFRYSWPRNVRELENTVRRLCIDSDTSRIAPEHLDARFFASELSSQLAAPTPIRSHFNSILKSQAEQMLTSGVSQREAARRLGMPESSLRRAMKKWSLSQEAMN